MRATSCHLLCAALGLAGCRDPAPAASEGGPPPPPAESTAPPAAPPRPRGPSTRRSRRRAEPAQRPLDRRAECAKDTCTLAHLVPDEVRPALSDGAPVVIWEQAIGERATVVFPRDEGVELLGVVLEGSVDLTPMDAPTARTVGGRWAGFRAPGGGVTLGGTGGKAARVALVIAVVEPGVGAGRAPRSAGQARRAPGVELEGAAQARRRLLLRRAAGRRLGRRRVPRAHRLGGRASTASARPAARAGRSTTNRPR